MSKQQPIILFDGSCNLCSASVRLIMRHSKKDEFTVVPFHSVYAKDLLRKYNVQENYSGSLVLVGAGKIYFKSTAVLRISKRLKGMYSLLYFLQIVPRFIRDGAYDWVASNRYNWFGKPKSCEVFIDKKNGL